MRVTDSWKGCCDGMYRLLDGAHRWSAYKSTGVEEVKAIIKDLNGDLSLGFTVAQVAQKHGWPDPMVWSLALEALFPA